MSRLQTIILAAGKGTRMKSSRVKVLHEVCGKALVDYVVAISRCVGSLKTCVVVGHQHQDVRAHLAKDVAVVVQKKLLGTADAVKAARAAISGTGDVLILCGDTVLLRSTTVKQLIQKHRLSKAACTFLTAQVECPAGYGRVVRDGCGAVVAIREDKDASAEEKAIREINVGVYCVQGAALFRFIGQIKKNPLKKEFYLTDLISLFAHKGLKIETATVADAGEGLGINTRMDLANAEYLIRQRVLENLMAQGVTIVDPLTTFIAADARIGQDTVIRPMTVIEKDVQIGRQCVIGPFARLRPGTRLGNNVEIGNFAEVSRTQLGDRCLQKHFSFVGDARVGVGTNIGAGTVTANYDGKNKNKTVIGKKAFIGSDSILVAPVNIGDEAVTGAGCVVTKGTVVPRQGVVLGVPARLMKKG